MYSVKLSRSDVVLILQAIKRRQDDCRRITADYTNHSIFEKLDLELEAVKMNLARQIPSEDKFSKG